MYRIITLAIATVLATVGLTSCSSTTEGSALATSATNEYVAMAMSDDPQVIADAYTRLTDDMLREAGIEPLDWMYTKDMAEFDKLASDPTKIEPSSAYVVLSELEFYRDQSFALPALAVGMLTRTYVETRDVMSSTPPKETEYMLGALNGELWTMLQSACYGGAVVAYFMERTGLAQADTDAAQIEDNLKIFATESDNDAMVNAYKVGFDAGSVQGGVCDQRFGQ